MPLKKINTEENVKYKNHSDVTYKSSLEKSKKNIYNLFTIQKTTYTLDDMILSGHTLNQIKDFLAYNKYSYKVFEEWGMSEVIHNNKKSQIANLYGPSGTGKTMAACAIANEMNKELLTVNYSQIESKYVGETAKNLEDVFKVAKDKDAILFFDEADALLSKRVTNMNNSTDVSVNQTRSVLLMILNNYEGVVLFATNFINNFDKAFMRRIPYHIKFELPDLKNRELLWNKYIPKKMPNTANILDLAKKYDNISASDICNAVLMAGFKAARQNYEYVDQSHFCEAINNIKKAKEENQERKTDIQERYVSEDYVKKQIDLKGV